MVLPRLGTPAGKRNAGAVPVGDGAVGIGR